MCQHPVVRVISESDKRPPALPFSSFYRQPPKQLVLNGIYHGAGFPSTEPTTLCSTQEGTAARSVLGIAPGCRWLAQIAVLELSAYCIDLKFHRRNRLDIALVYNMPIALIFLPAADIPRFVGEGNVDLGITGQDQVYEYELQDALNRPKELLCLNFGQCSLQVQVPEAGEISSPEQLLGKRVATSFKNITKRYFKKLAIEESQRGIVVKTVSGSVEASCALGVADGIVDLVESGETMRAAGLKALCTVFESEAVLIQSAHRKPQHEPLIANLSSRIQGLLAANRYILCQYNVPRELLAKAVTITPGRRAPTVTPLEGVDWVSVSSMVEKKQVAEIMDKLQAIECRDILVLQIQNSRYTNLIVHTGAD